MSQFKREKRDVSGWLVLDKPYDMSSTEAVGKLRWLFGAKKAGHAGTLDPLATGILPIAFGEATKTVPVVQDGRKTYRFAVRWGEARTTEDAEGEVTATSPIRPDEAAIQSVLGRFTGAIAQVPPVFSAIHVDGARAYDLARAGEAPDLPPRTVVIDKLVLVEATTETARFEVVCAKGTYVRALARDLAHALGTLGYVAQLRRCAVGSFDESRAVSLEAIEAVGREDRDALLLPVAAGLVGLPEIALGEREAMLVRQGNAVLLTGSGAPVTLDAAWASHRGRAIALGSVAAGRFQPARVILG